MAELQSFAFYFMVVVVSTLLLRAIFSMIKPVTRLPPSPLALPIIGHLHLLGPLPHIAFYKLTKCYGPLIHLRLGSTSAIIVSSPDTARSILQTHEMSFASRSMPTTVQRLSLGVPFIFAPYGPFLKFMKKLSVTELLSSSALDMMQPIRSQELLGLLQVALRKSKAGEAMDLSAEMIKMSNNVISRMAIGQRCLSLEDEVHLMEMIEETVETVAKFNLADYLGIFKYVDVHGLENKCKDLIQRFSTFLEKIISEHENKRKIMKEMGVERGNDKDLVDILLNIAQDENGEIPLTREIIAVFIWEILLAGTETSAVLKEWILAELLNHPNVLKKAREEIESVVGNERLVHESDIPNLPYIQAIVKETLRLHPPITVIPRKSDHGCRVLGYDIPANSAIFINIWAMARDPNVWNNPFEFQPERFMQYHADDHKGSSSRTSSNADYLGQNFQFLPFGSGRRRCPGANLALHVVHTTVAAMIQSFDLEYVGPRGEKTLVDMSEKGGLTVGRVHPLPCLLTPRLCPSLYSSDQSPMRHRLPT